MYTKKNGRVTFKSNKRTNFKRNNNFAFKGRYKGNITQQYNKYLKLAKDTFSSGDRIQAEYYYQFTDHYYRLMIELGINLEEQESSQDAKLSASENIKPESSSEDVNEENENTEVVKSEKSEKEEDIDSIESIPFISDPIKKKRSRSLK